MTDKLGKDQCKCLLQEERTLIHDLVLTARASTLREMSATRDTEMKHYLERYEEELTSLINKIENTPTCE